MKAQPHMIAVSISVADDDLRITKWFTSRLGAALVLRKWRTEVRRIQVNHLRNRNCYTHGEVTMVVPRV